MENRIRAAFDRVKAPEEVKTAAAGYLRSLREQAVPRRRAPGWGRLAAACALLALTVGVGGWRVVRTPVSYVSIDINPSVELSLNRFDRVVEAVGYNEDGRRVLEGLSLDGLPYAQAVDRVLEGAAAGAYLNEDGAVVVTVAAGDEGRRAELVAGLGTSAGYAAYGGSCYSADVDSIPEAHSHGLSFGKYAAYQELAQYDEAVTVEDCHRMSMGELQARISACQEGHREEGGQAGGQGHHGHGGHH